MRDVLVKSRFVQQGKDERFAALVVPSWTLCRSNVGDLRAEDGFALAMEGTTELQRDIAVSIPAHLDYAPFKADTINGRL